MDTYYNKLATVIENLRDFYNQLTIEDSREASLSIIAGEPFIAVERIFGPDWALYVQKKIYRKVLIFMWRATTIHYPLRFQISTYFGANYFCKNVQKLSQIFYYWKPSNSLKDCYSAAERSIDIDPSIFPMEIWEAFTQYNVNPANLIRVNKRLCNFFAPRIYQELNMSLVVSDTKKMRLNDACFLKYGPDFLEDWPHIDSYGIYKRHQKSQEFDFEFLDISKGPQQGYGDQYFDGLMTDHKKILYIFKHILSNPNSILKRYIKDASVNVQILHGTNKILKTETSEGWTLSTILRDHLRKKGGVLYAEAENIPYDAKAILETFSYDRWVAPYSSLLRERLLMYGNRDLYFTKKEFPERVFIKELLGVAIMLNFLQKGTNRRKISSLQSNADLVNDDPFRDYLNYKRSEFGRAPSEHRDRQLYLEYLSDVTSNLALKEIKETKIDSREFFTGREVREILLMMAKTMSCSTTNESVNCSFLIIGQARREIYELGCVEAPGAFYNGNWLCPFSPYTIVINKPNTIGREIRRDKRKVRLEKKRKKQKGKNKRG